eukprot:4465639-Pleurochrysis_carterae.AAC.5
MYPSDGVDNGAHIAASWTRPSWQAPEQISCSEASAHDSRTSRKPAEHGPQIEATEEKLVSTLGSPAHSVSASLTC